MGMVTQEMRATTEEVLHGVTRVPSVGLEWNYPLGDMTESLVSFSHCRDFCIVDFFLSLKNRLYNCNHFELL